MVQVPIMMHAWQIMRLHLLRLADVLDLRGAQKRRSDQSKATKLEDGGGIGDARDCREALRDPAWLHRPDPRD